MKQNIAAICKKDLQGNTLEVNLSYSAHLLTRVQRKAFFCKVAGILHMLFVFAGGLGWIIYGFAINAEGMGDIPRLVWLSIVILPLIPFLLDVIFAIIEKLVPVRKCTEPCSDDDMLANLSCIDQNLRKARRATISYSIITLTDVGSRVFPCVTALIVLWDCIPDLINSPEVKIGWGELIGTVGVACFISWMYSALFLLLANWWVEHIFNSEKDSKNIDELLSSYSAYAWRLRFEAMTPEEQHRLLEEKKRVEEEHERLREKVDGHKRDMARVSMAGWTWSPSDSASTGGLTDRDHDILDDLSRANQENWSNGM